jgi:hypothetical protein
MVQRRSSAFAPALMTHLSTGDGGSLLPQLVPRDALALGHDLGLGRRLGRGRHGLGRGLGLGRRLGLLGLLGASVNLGTFLTLFFLSGR